MHPRDTLKRDAKKQRKIICQAASYVSTQQAKRITDKEDVTFAKQMPQHPLDRFKKVIKNSEFDGGTLKEIHHINIEAPMDHITQR